MFDKLIDEDFKRFRDIIYQESGMNFTKTNRPILESRLKERLRELNIPSVTDYYALILKDDNEMKNLLDAVTTNLTKFFRNETQFKVFDELVIDDLIKNKKDDHTLKLWSAGCSTGEEPYSLAMVLKEKLDPTWIVQIVASDISFNALMKAKEGFYTKDKVAGIPDKYLKKYMIEIGEGFYVKDEIKDMISFDYHNLKNDSGLRNFDIVFCRNVIIYFDAEAQQKVINHMYDSMTSYSYLFIGHSESLFGMKTKFIFTKIGEACLYMKKEGEPNERR
jgi:chemotaxis protein methyltransferase CheR